MPVNQILRQHLKLEDLSHKLFMSSFQGQMLAKFHHAALYGSNFTLSFSLQELSFGRRENGTNIYLIEEVLQWFTSLGFYLFGIHAGAIELDCFLLG